MKWQGEPERETPNNSSRNQLTIVFESGIISQGDASVQWIN